MKRLILVIMLACTPLAVMAGNPVYIGVVRNADGETLRSAIFGAYGDSRTLEKEVNEWFDKNPKVEIISVEFRQSGERTGTYFSVMILYRTKK
jgi:hypothetical protein